jgi:hypothetical protein
MIIFEYFFKVFDARGSGEYLSAWATDVDRMADQGWELVERIPRLHGQWTVLFCRPGERFHRHETEKNVSKDLEA